MNLAREEAGSRAEKVPRSLHKMRIRSMSRIALEALVQTAVDRGGEAGFATGSTFCVEEGLSRHRLLVI